MQYDEGNLQFILLPSLLAKTEIQVIFYLLAGSVFVI